jgi:hypothetical protein
LRGRLAGDGALGQHGSIAVSEHSLGSLEREMWRVLPLVPLRAVGISRHVAAYVEWYEAHRPHQGLGGWTAREVRVGVASRVRIEPRAPYPAKRGVTRVKVPLVLRTERLRGEPHLPVFELTKAV